MAVTRMLSRAVGTVVVFCLSTAEALPDTGLSADAGEDGSVGTERQCDVYIAGVATSPRSTPLRYRWLDGVEALTPWKNVRADRTAPVELCGLSVGRHALTLEVTDGKTTVSDTVIATIEGSVSPGLAATQLSGFPTR